MKKTKMKKPMKVESVRRLPKALHAKARGGSVIIEDELMYASSILIDDITSM